MVVNASYKEPSSWLSTPSATPTSSSAVFLAFWLDLEGVTFFFFPLTALDGAEHTKQTSYHSGSVYGIDSVVEPVSMHQLRAVPLKLIIVRNKFVKFFFFNLLVYPTLRQFLKLQSNYNCFTQI